MVAGGGGWVKKKNIIEISGGFYLLLKYVAFQSSYVVRPKINSKWLLHRKEKESETNVKCTVEKKIVEKKLRIKRLTRMRNGNSFFYLEKKIKFLRKFDVKYLWHMRH